MIDLIRASAVPANLMQAAARGALALPADEMIEIMVHLANHNKIHGDTARMTLAGWDEKSSLQVALNPDTPPEVLRYLISPENLRPTLLRALLDNPSVSEEGLTKLASTGSREIVEAMLASLRVRNSSNVRKALIANPHVTARESVELGEAVRSQKEPLAAAPSAGENAIPVAQDAPPVDTISSEAGNAEDAVDEQVVAFLQEHKDEIAAEEGKPFQAVGGVFDELATSNSAAADPAASQATLPLARSAAGTPVRTAFPQQQQERRGSALQKIASLDIKGRIQLAMKGSKEERSILIRDGTKIVALAVLDSPKLTDGEVEAFASQKNVLEAVLRGIPLKRRFAKNYLVVRNLTFNPRTPLDLSLGLMKHLLINDLKNLATNKEVSDTIRKLAVKMFKQKSETSKKKKSD